MSPLLCHLGQVPLCYSPVGSTELGCRGQEVVASVRGKGPACEQSLGVCKAKGWLCGLPWQDHLASVVLAVKESTLCQILNEGGPQKEIIMGKCHRAALNSLRAQGSRVATLVQGPSPALLCISAPQWVSMLGSDCNMAQQKVLHFPPTAAKPLLERSKNH